MNDDGDGYFKQTAHIHFSIVHRANGQIVFICILYIDRNRTGNMSHHINSKVGNTIRIRFYLGSRSIPVVNIKDLIFNLLIRNQTTNNI